MAVIIYALGLSLRPRHTCASRLFAQGRNAVQVQRWLGQASIAFDGQLIVGSLPARALRLVRDWAALHQAELEDNWKRAVDGEALRKIDPLP